MGDLSDESEQRGKLEKRVQDLEKKVEDLKKTCGQWMKKAAKDAVDTALAKQAWKGSSSAAAGRKSTSAAEASKAPKKKYLAPKKKTSAVTKAKVPAAKGKSSSAGREKKMKSAPKQQQKENDDAHYVPKPVLDKSKLFEKGTKVRKKFSDQFFDGEVVEVDMDDPDLPYLVRYNDGDEEDLTHAELEKIKV